MNFTNIANAIKAIEGVKGNPAYASLRVSHGKDRCTNPPRSGPQGGSGRRHGGSSQLQSAVEPPSDAASNGFAEAQGVEAADAVTVSA